MSLQPASLGRVWLGPQTARGSAASAYYSFKANLLDVAPQQLLRSMGQMVGGNLVPGGSVKTAAWGGGALVMPPALDDYIGWLLYAFAGSVSSVDNGDGTYTHYFPAGADSAAPEKYLTGRRSVPGSSTLYEQITDLRPFRLLWGLTPGEFATLRAEMMGRVPSSPDGSAWTYTPKEYEDSTPVVCNGAFELPDGQEIETSTGITLEMVNLVPDLRRVLVGGSPYPFDFPVMGRAITVQFSFLWQNKTLYDSLFYDSGSWQPQVYSSSYEATIQSANFITGALPYQIVFHLSNADWQAQPLALRGGDLVEMGMIGTLKAATSGFDWFMAVRNSTSGYSWT